MVELEDPHLLPSQVITLIGSDAPPRSAGRRRGGALKLVGGLVVMDEPEPCLPFSYTGKTGYTTNRTAFDFVKPASAQLLISNCRILLFRSSFSS